MNPGPVCLISGCLPLRVWMGRNHRIFKGVGFQKWRHVWEEDNSSFSTFKCIYTGEIRLYFIISHCGTDEIASWSEWILTLMDFHDVPRGWLQQCTIRAYNHHHIEVQPRFSTKADWFSKLLEGISERPTVYKYKIDAMMNVEPPGLAPFSSQPQSRLFHSGFWNNDLYGNPTCHQGQKRDKTWDYLKIKAPVGEAGVPVVWDHFPIQMLCHKSRD